jgi:hypothetical protein
MPTKSRMTEQEKKAAAEHPLVYLVRRLRSMARHEHDDLSIAEEAADEIERLCHRVNSLRGLCKSASGWLFDLDDIKHADIVLDLIGDMEPNE